MKSFVSSFLIMLSTAATAHGQARNDVSAAVHLDPSRIPLSGRLTLTFTVEGPANLEVERMQEPSQSPVWQAKALAGPETTPLPNGRVRWRQSFRLEPLQTGQVTLPLTPIRYRLGKGRWTTHAWADQSIEVTTEVFEPAVTGLRGNSQIEELPPAATWPIEWLIVFGLLLVGSTIAFVAWRRAGRHDRPSLELPPDQWALKEIERIERLNLPQAGEVERYHRLLCDVLRQFVERHLKLPATTQTTLEFLTAIRQSSPFRDDQPLRQFLERCDLAKFARAEFGVGECRQTADLARSFISATRVP